MDLVILVFILLVVAAAVVIGGLLYSRRSVAKPKPASEPIPNSRRAIEISIGLVGWYLLNGLIWFWVAPYPLTGGSNYSLLFSLIMIPANVVVMVICGVIPRLRMVALGILIALALNFLISLILGMATNAICFVPFFHK